MRATDLGFRHPDDVSASCGFDHKITYDGRRIAAKKTFDKTQSTRQLQAKQLIISETKPLSHLGMGESLPEQERIEALKHLRHRKLMQKARSSMYNRPNTTQPSLSRSRSRTRSRSPWRSRSPKHQRRLCQCNLQGASQHDEVMGRPQVVRSGFAGFEGFMTSSYRFSYRDDDLTRQNTLIGPGLYDGPANKDQMLRGACMTKIGKPIQGDKDQDYMMIGDRRVHVPKKTDVPLLLSPGQNRLFNRSSVCNRQSMREMDKLRRNSAKPSCQSNTNTRVDSAAPNMLEVQSVKTRSGSSTGFSRNLTRNQTSVKVSVKRRKVPPKSAITSATAAPLSLMSPSNANFIAVADGKGTSRQEQAAQVENFYATQQLSRKMRGSASFNKRASSCVRNRQPARNNDLTSKSLVLGRMPSLSHLREMTVTPTTNDLAQVITPQNREDVVQMALEDTRVISPSSQATSKHKKTMSLIDECISNLKSIRAQQGDKKQRNLQKYIHDKKKILTEIDQQQQINDQDKIAKLKNEKARRQRNIAPTTISLSRFEQRELRKSVDLLEAYGHLDNFMKLNKKELKQSGLAKHIKDMKSPPAKEKTTKIKRRPQHNYQLELNDALNIELDKIDNQKDVLQNKSSGLLYYDYDILDAGQGPLNEEYRGDLIQPLVELNRSGVDRIAQIAVEEELDQPQKQLEPVNQVIAESVEQTEEYTAVKSDQPTQVIEAKSMEEEQDNMPGELEALDFKEQQPLQITHVVSPTSEDPVALLQPEQIQVVSEEQGIKPETELQVILQEEAQPENSFEEQVNVLQPEQVVTQQFMDKKEEDSSEKNAELTGQVKSGAFELPVHLPSGESDEFSKAKWVPEIVQRRLTELDDDLTPAARQICSTRFNEMDSKSNTEAEEVEIDNDSAEIKLGSQQFQGPIEMVKMQSTPLRQKPVLTIQRLQEPHVGRRRSLLPQRSFAEQSDLKSTTSAAMTHLNKANPVVDEGTPMHMTSGEMSPIMYRESNLLQIHKKGPPTETGTEQNHLDLIIDEQQNSLMLAHRVSFSVVSNTQDGLSHSRLNALSRSGRHEQSSSSPKNSKGWNINSQKAGVHDSSDITHIKNFSDEGERGDDPERYNYDDGNTQQSHMNISKKMYESQLNMLEKRNSSSYMLANDASCETRVQGARDIADKVEQGRGLFKVPHGSNEISSVAEADATQSEMFSKVITGSGEPKKLDKTGNLQRMSNMHSSTDRLGGVSERVNKIGRSSVITHQTKEADPQSGVYDQSMDCLPSSPINSQKTYLMKEGLGIKKDEVTHEAPDSRSRQSNMMSALGHVTSDNEQGASTALARQMVLGEFADLVVNEDRSSMQMDDEQQRSSLNVSVTQANETALKQTFNPAVIMKGGYPFSATHDNGGLICMLQPDTNSAQNFNITPALNEDNATTTQINHQSQIIQKLDDETDDQCGPRLTSSATASQQFSRNILLQGLELKEDDLFEGKPSTKPFFSDQIPAPIDMVADPATDALGTDSKAIQSSIQLDTTSQPEACSNYIEQNDEIGALKRGQTQTEAMALPDPEQKALVAKVINRQASAGGRRTHNRSPSAIKGVKRRNNKSTGGVQNTKSMSNFEIEFEEYYDDEECEEDEVIIEDKDAQDETEWARQRERFEERGYVDLAEDDEAELASQSVDYAVAQQQLQRVKEKQKELRKNLAQRQNRPATSIIEERTARLEQSEGTTSISRYLGDGLYSNSNSGNKRGTYVRPVYRSRHAENMKIMPSQANNIQQPIEDALPAQEVEPSQQLVIPLNLVPQSSKMSADDKDVFTPATVVLSQELAIGVTQQPMAEIVRTNEGSYLVEYRYYEEEDDEDADVSGDMADKDVSPGPFEVAYDQEHHPKNPTQSIQTQQTSSPMPGEREGITLAGPPTMVQAKASDRKHD